MKRAFEFMQLDPNLLSMLDGLTLSSGGEIERCAITFEQSRMLTRVRKRNTIFCDQLTKVLGLGYDMTDVQTDFLYEAIFVDMNALAEEESIFVSAETEGRRHLTEVPNKTLKKWLFLHGFSISGVPVRTAGQPRPLGKSADTVTETIHYRAFVASASMARKGQVLFVNEQVYRELMERLTLDFYSFDEEKKQLRMPNSLSAKAYGDEVFFYGGSPKKHGFEVTTSKFYAYLGLMLSDGSSLEELSAAYTATHGAAPELPVLNENTVFMAKDMKVDARPYYAALGDYAWIVEETDGDHKEKDAKVYAAKLRKTSELEASFTMFDGMGFCDNQYFDLLENLLLCRKPEEGTDHPVNAIIIRLPWLKGVLVRADFQGFFQAQAGNALEGCRIRDFFGIERELRDIHIIVTDSMMKGSKYLTNLHRFAEQGTERLPDPWAHYWQTIERYGISLLITGKNSGESRREHTNYQFLSTAGLSDGTMDILCGRMADGILGDLQELRTDPHREEAPVDTLDRLMEALDEGSRAQLRNTDYICRAAQGYARSRLLDGMRGRLEVEGDYRFVAPDLMAYLHYLYDRYVAKIERPALRSALNTTDKGCIGHGYYYASGRKAPWKKCGEDGKITETEMICLRNPHYAMGESVVAAPLDEDTRSQYDLWFGHLFSVVMLPNTAVGTIGGADFDGDRCLCLSDDAVMADIKAAIEQNKQHLRYMMNHRADYADLLDGCLSSVAKDLKGWLDKADYIPHEADFAFRRHACPPLIFGADGHAMDFRCAESNIEEKLYTSFDLTTKQRIGELSLLALQYSSKAYKTCAEDSFGTTGPWTSEQFGHLEAWLWHWRMVSLALENGMEIDMAKTGIRPMPAPLRVNQGIRIHADDPRQLADLFALYTKDSLMGTFRKLEARPDKNGQALRRLRGRNFDDLLRSRMQKDNVLGMDMMDLSRQLLARGHNNTELLPYRMYTSLQTKTDLLPEEERGGTRLAAFLRSRWGIEPAGSSSENAAPAEISFAAPNPITMADLVWADDTDRKAVVEAYLSHYLPQGEKEQGFDGAVVTDHEQGIYFLKEAAKFLFHARLSEISADGDVPLTPAALGEKLREILPDTGDRLAYLLQYRGRAYDRVENESRNIMDDHLLLALIGSDIGCFVHPADGQRNSSVDEEKRRAADALMLAYGEGKLRRSGHEKARIRLGERYRYCMRNLQRRYSLSNAIGHMGAYSGEYADTPLGSFGVPAEKLSRVFADMEEMKSDAEEVEDHAGV